jgi:hypothetical protein
VREALTTLPWVEPKTIVADRRTQQVKFTVKTKSAFDLDEVKKALGERYDDGVAVLTGPTE